MTDPTPIIPDEKDWTVVLHEGCAECGWQPQEPTRTGALLRDTITRWQSRLADDDVHDRPSPMTWSPLEYGCHVRDVCVVFRERLALMLAGDDPTFDNWDQDHAAVAGEYHRQDPVAVGIAYGKEATATAAAFDGVLAHQWDRKGFRSNGAHFTIATLAQYFWHDIHHHLHDVGA